MKDLLLGIDVGTYSSKAVLTELDGRILRTETIAHGISTPQPGYVEQDADAVWWNDVKLLCKKIFSHNSYTANDVAGIAVSAIGPCLLPLCAQGNPLRPAILYGVDTRAEMEIDDINAELGETAIFAHSKMALTSQAVTPKLRWLQTHEPHIWARTHFIASASSYLVMKLTGSNTLDHHTASHFMPLYDPVNHSWSEKYTNSLDISIKTLPKLGWSHEIAGKVTAVAAEATGLIVGTPVAVGAVDALSEAISVGVCEPGDLMIMYGSTTFFILVQDSPKPDPRVWTTAGAYADQYNLAAGMSTTGSLTRWFTDQLARELPVDAAYDHLFSAAARIPAGAEGVLVLPYFSGERTPINDTKAKGVIAGLSLNHTREHMFKAVLEGVAFGIRHNLETFSQIGAEVKRIVAVGGGAKSEIWPQIVSDVCGKEQMLPHTTVGASYGNAFLAGCSVGLLNRQDIKNWVQADRIIRPNSNHRPLYDALYQDYLTLYRDTRGVVHRLSKRYATQ
jgi:xylulokinase